MSGEKTWCAGGGIKPHTEGGSFKLDSRLRCISTKCMNPLKTRDQPPDCLSWFLFLDKAAVVLMKGFEGASQGATWSRSECELEWGCELVRTGGAGSHLKARAMQTEACRAAPNRLWLWRGGELGGWSFKSLRSPPVKLLPVYENKAGFRLATQESAQPQGDFRRK